MAVITKNTGLRPNVRPTLNLDFAGSKSVDKRINFTRNSRASYYDEKGVVQIANTDKPRIDFDPTSTVGACKGLLLEESRTNLFKYTSSLDGSTHTVEAGSYRNNAILAPDGTYSGIAVVESTTNYCRTTQQVTIVSGSTYTFSAYVKAGTRSRVHMQIYSNTTNVDRVFDLTGAGSVYSGTGTAGIVAVGNGWYRIYVTATVGSTTGYGFVYPAVDNYTYAHTNGTVGIYVWGFQFELGSFATSYIPSVETFGSRSSSATYLDETGTIKFAGINQARYGYYYDESLAKWTSQGLLLEPAKTNTNIHSNGVTGNQGIENAVLDQIAPDGSRCYRGQSFLFSDFTDSVNQSLVQSFFVKKVDWRYIRVGWSGVGPNNSINFGNGVVGTSADAIFDFDTGTFTARGDSGGERWMVDAIGNGWFRLWINYTNGPSYVGGCTVIRLATGATNFTVTTGYYFAAWGAQHEVGTTPTSYIPTGASSVTRSADSISSVTATRASENAYVNMANIASPREFTIYGEAAALGINTGRIVSFAESSTDSSSTYSVNFETSYFRAYQYHNATLAFNTTGAGYVAGTYKKFALGVSTISGAYSFIADAFSQTGSGALTMATDDLRIGSMLPSQYYMSGHIKKISYFTEKLSDNELTALTR